ncbi:MAG: thioredoxin [Chitinophagaceae bacterium]|nr:MAG: thioredoxin [Chitinophagaceae bacterium]
MFRFFTITACFVILIIACQSDSRKTAVDPQRFEAALAADSVQLLDVRTPKEFQAGHLENALQADWTNQAEFKERISHLDKSKPVFVYCGTGNRSASAGDLLIAQGFTVTEMNGGFNAWKAANKPIVQLPNEMPVSLTEYKVLTNLSPVVLVDIGADWCPPCKKMEPVLETLGKDLRDNFKLVKIDAGIQTDLMRKVGAEQIPTFIIYKNGIETWRKVGIVGIEELKYNLQ